jgi:ABC-2 type transport system permease protein
MTSAPTRGAASAPTPSGVRPPAGPGAGPRAGSLTGTGQVLRLALRRDRILVPAWTLGIAGMATMSAQATVGLYPDLPQRVQAAEVVNGSAALIALYGRIYDPTSLGELSMFKLTAFGAAIIGVVFAYLAVRHTRGEEEAGRLELVGSTVLGRAAPLAAAMGLVAITAGALALLTGVGLWVAGLPFAGSLAFGAAWGATGLLFGAVGAVAAQLATTARAATGLSLVALAVAYVARAAGDLAEQAPGLASWLSPIGWTQQVRAFSGTRWEILVLPLLATAVLVPVAFALRSRRDLDAGLLPDRPGPAQGRVGSAWGLAARLQRPALLGWAAGVVVMGLVLGSVADSVEGFLDSEAMRDIVAALGGEGALVDMFLAAELGFVGAILAGAGIAAVRWLPHEEASGRAEAVLATATSRRSWALSHAVVAMLGVAVLVLLAGLAIGTGYALVVGDPGQVVRLAGAAATRIPAALVMVGIAVAIWGFWPRAGWLAWALFVVFLALGEFGTLWGVPGPVMDLSPFRHSPMVPGPDPAFAALPVLLAVAVGLVALGAWRFGRRDVSAD